MEPSTNSTAANDDDDVVPVLSDEEFSSRVASGGHGNWGSYRGFFSSLVGGITTQPHLMSLPIDDHMVHRGHAVFDTALIRAGFLYELDEHLDRFLKSAAAASIPPAYSRSKLRHIIIQLAAVSEVHDGSVRYWMSVGPGGFTLSTKECPVPAFYAVVLAYNPKPVEQVEGVRVITSSVPMKPPVFATMKTVNYLPNALVKKEAEEKGAFDGIWVDEGGFVLEGPSMNVAFVGENDELLVPHFEEILAGCTMKKVMRLAEQLVKDKNEDGPRLSSIRFGPVHVDEARRAKEMMLCGSGVQVEPVVMWDDIVVGNGKLGPVTLALRELLHDDFFNGPDRIRIPYGQ